MVQGSGPPQTRPVQNDFHIQLLTLTVISFKDRFEQAVQQLKKLNKLAKLDADKCIAEGKLLLCNDVYKNPNIASSLQCFVSTMDGLHRAIDIIIFH